MVWNTAGHGTVCPFWGLEKQTIFYELELLASILALDFWASSTSTGLQVCFGDNDGARFSLIRGSCLNGSSSITCCVRLRITCALGLPECRQKQTLLTIRQGTCLTSCWNRDWTNQLQRQSGLKIWQKLWNWDQPDTWGSADSLVPLDKKSVALPALMWPTLETRHKNVFICN